MISDAGGVVRNIGLNGGLRSNGPQPYPSMPLYASGIVKRNEKHASKSERGTLFR